MSIAPLPLALPYTRHTLLWLLNSHRITMIKLAHKADVRLDVIHAIVWNIQVDQYTAERVVAALSSLSGYKYTLKEVKIPIFDPQKKEQFPMNTERLVDDRLSVMLAPADKEYPELEFVLTELGCEIIKHSTYVKVIFPPGTTRMEIFPRVHHERYLITLPDGTQFGEHQFMIDPDLHILTIPDTLIERYFPGYILKHQRELGAQKSIE